MLKDLEEKQVTKVSEINTGLGGNREVLKKKYYHLIILVKNQMGLKNLYKIVSEAHVNYFFKKPRVPRSLLNKYRDGLLLTSACEAGELYRAIVDGTPYEELKKIRRSAQRGGARLIFGLLADFGLGGFATFRDFVTLLPAFFVCIAIAGERW